MEEIIKGKERQKSIEQYAIDELLKKTKGFLDSSIIEERISKYLRKGIYLVSSQELATIEEKELVKGVYNNDLGLILLDSDWFELVPDVAVHEMAHAYLNSENKVKISINEIEVGYGVGLEEGAVSILQKISSFSDINDCVVDSYRYQAHLFKQLNVLYQYDSSKKYSNLLENLLNEPSKFLSTIFGIYNNILSNTTLEMSEIIDLSYKCAGAIVMSTDAMTDNIGIESNELFKVCNSINSVFLSLADSKIREEKETHNLFPIFKESYITSEEKLLNLIFGCDSLDNYYNRQKELLYRCLTVYTNEMDTIKSNQSEQCNLKIKVK